MAQVQKKRHNAHQKHIPAEIVHEILSGLSSDSLSSAALVNRNFQAEADRLLYRSVGHRMHPILPCLGTIASVKNKAVLVKSLSIYVHRNCSYCTSKSTSAIIKCLSASLPNMTALTNLRLHIIEITEEQRISLMRTLQRSTFSLTSFCVSVELDLGLFVSKQTNLQYLVFDYGPASFHSSELSRYQTLVENSLPENQLTLFILERRGLAADSIMSFPVFSLNWSAVPIKQALLGLLVYPSNISHFSLCIDTLSDDGHLRQFTRSISENFPGIAILFLYVKDHQIDMNPEGVASALSCLTNLWLFAVLYLEPKAMLLSQDDMVDLARRWSAQCPRLSTVQFSDFGVNWISIYLDE